MVNFPANQLGSNANSLVTAVADAIDKVAPSDAEKKERNNELARAARHHEALQDSPERQDDFLADIANARELERRVQESEQASWLAKNVHHLLAIGITLLTFSLYTIVILGGSKEGFLKPETKDIVIYILGALTTVATQVVSYYFGSSSGSADKSRAINALSRRR